MHRYADVDGATESYFTSRKMLDQHMCDIGIRSRKLFYFKGKLRKILGQQSNSRHFQARALWISIQNSSQMFFSSPQAFSQRNS
mmetsp:Transcript_25715/g.39388  ORF Transcript_25715/g.39388 Transcript_25715/m.39388 type:complete len:84 (-) Transcript_25715:4657-4908(-)